MIEGLTWAWFVDKAVMLGILLYVMHKSKIMMMQVVAWAYQMIAADMGQKQGKAPTIGQAAGMMAYAAAPKVGAALGDKISAMIKGDKK